MRVKDKPATPTPSRLLGLVLLIGGGLFIGDFFWSLATYSPSIAAAPPAAWAVLVAGMLAGSVLVGVGIAAMLHATGQLDLPAHLEWDL
ncbi:MAG: hypothetical protein ABEJ31_06395 [Haloarculaceae archaeon]